METDQSILQSKQEEQVKPLPGVGAVGGALHDAKEVVKKFAKEIVPEELKPAIEPFTQPTDIIPPTSQDILRQQERDRQMLQTMQEKEVKTNAAKLADTRSQLDKIIAAKPERTVITD